MEELVLSETEARYFGDLFLCCDEEADGRAPLLKATELFRSSNISNEALKQIMEISVAPNTISGINHLNRKQFYSALKLIAAHQASMALQPELLATQLDLPLPRFTWALNCPAASANADLIQLSNSPKEQHIGKMGRHGSLGSYAPMRVSSNLSDSDAGPQLDNTELSTDSEMESETRSDLTHPMRNASGSPWSAASESPTPTNSVAERRPHPVWENSATGRGVWPANTAEEHTQLLGTEEESSDRHSSEEEGEAGEGGEAGEIGEVWAVSAAQARHYATQFAQLQPDARGLLPGYRARLFFEKSRLGVGDLRKIWQLADLTSDGALSLEEFSIAMHLIVLRRNDVPVPDTLPACLLPALHSRGSRAEVTSDLVDLGSDMFSSGTSADFNLAPREPPPPEPARRTPRTPRTPPSPPHDARAKHWTKFVDSPTSSLASPGPKPVNFDFRPVKSERDPNIFHPVALRVTPDANSLPQHDDARSSVSPHAFELVSPKRMNSVPPAEANGGDIKPLQRPQAKKPLKPAGVLPPPPARDAPPAAPAPASAPAAPPAPAAAAAALDDAPLSLQYPPKKEAPPPPPPRPLRSHARSSSLDLNRLAAAPAHPPPAHPPPARAPLAPAPAAPAPAAAAAAPAAAEFANFAQFEGAARHGAFEVYRKPAGAAVGVREEEVEEGEGGGVRALREQNALLHRVCRALCLELADVQRERESLRLRLDSNAAPL